MFVVGAAADRDADACLVGFTTQCSIEPPRFAAFLSKSNRTYEIATRAEVLVLHLIRPEQGAEAAGFGRSSVVGASTAAATGIRTTPASSTSGLRAPARAARR